MKFKYLSLTFILFYISPVIAANQDIREDAISCAALYYIMTFLPKQNPRYTQGMTSLGQTMSAIYSVHENKMTGKRVSNVYILSLIGTKIKYFGKFYDKNRSSVVNEYLFCNKWRNIIAKYVSKHRQSEITTENKMKNFILNIPTPPDRKNLNLSQNGNVKKAVDLSFRSWARKGKPIPIDIEKILKALKDKK